MSFLQKVTIVGDEQGSTFTLTNTQLRIKRKQEKKWDWPEWLIPWRHVVWAGLVDGQFEVNFLSKGFRRKGPLRLERCTGKVDEVSLELVGKLMRDIESAAYVGVKPGRRLKVFVNPKAGPGKSEQLFNKEIEPMLRAAHCKLDVTYTTHFQHAIEVSRDLPLEQFDAVITVGGDGMVYEVLNGFAEHKDPLRALKIPIAPIPTGSGNALSLNLLGVREGLDILAATLNGVKGRPMPIDVFSVVQGPKRALSYMMQTTGLLAEADLGSERAGSTRFMVYFLIGVAKHKRVPIKLQIKVATADKQKMVDDLCASRRQAKIDLEQTLSQLKSANAPSDEPTDAKSEPLDTTAPEDEGDNVAGTSHAHRHRHTSSSGSEPARSDFRKSSSGGSVLSDTTPGTTPPRTPPPSSSTLPPLKFASLKDEELREEDGWTTVTDSMMWCVAGKGPYAGEALMSFPVSIPNDGLIDVVVHTPTTRTGLIKAIDGADKGQLFWRNEEKYYKAEAYRVTPIPSRKRSSCVSVDGEAFKFEPYHVEVHPGLATLLSPYGCYCTEFNIPPPGGKGKGK